MHNLTGKVLEMKYPPQVYVAAQLQYVADYPRLPFGNRTVPDFNDYLAREYVRWFDGQFLYALGISQ